MRGFILDDRGSAAVWMLLFIPVLLAAALYTITLTQSVTASDVDLTGALEAGVKAAALQVTADSQADGDPRIHAARALAAFKKEMARNLGLDGMTMSPLPGSMLSEAPDWVLVVYNGDGAYASSGAPAGKKYVFVSGVLNEYDVGAAGFPYHFGVTASGVSPGGTGDFQVELETPGVVAVATTRAVRITGGEDLAPVRWAAARIVKTGGGS